MTQTLTAPVTTLTLTQRLLSVWRNEDNKGLSARACAAKAVSGLQTDELTYLAEQYVAGLFASTARTKAVSAQKRAAKKFTKEKEIFPKPVIRGKAAREAEEARLAAIEAKRQNEVDRAFVLSKRLKSQTDDYAENYAFDVTAELLDSVIEIGNGTEKRFGDVTLPEWRTRVNRSEAALLGLAATTGREKAYTAFLEKHEVNSFNEYMAKTM